MKKHLFQVHPWHGVTPGPNTPGLVNAYIEIVPTDAVKYELDKVSGHLRVDRPQRFSSLCPTLYGFIPQTFCGRDVAELCEQRTGRTGIEGDKDPMDICVLSEKTFAHGSFFLNARPIGNQWYEEDASLSGPSRIAIGGLRMIDGQQADDKIVAVLEDDLAYGRIAEIADVPPGLIERLKHYFLSYKQLPSDTKKKVEIVQAYDRAEALEVIARSLRDYEREFGGGE